MKVRVLNLVSRGLTSHKRREKGCLSSIWGLPYIHQRASGVSTRLVTRVVTNMWLSRKCVSTVAVLWLSCDSVTGAARCDCGCKWVITVASLQKVQAVNTSVLGSGLILTLCWLCVCAYREHLDVCLPADFAHISLSFSWHFLHYDLINKVYKTAKRHAERGYQQQIRTGCRLALLDIE